jgi:antitoxin VapB
MTQTAKIFRNGASQAVRLPREFRFDADEVCIKRMGSAVLLFPRKDAWKLMGQVLGTVDMPARRQPRRSEKRKSL